MLTLAELKKDRDLIDEINWDMTPEEAVRLYLEWGNNWARGDGYVIRSKNDFTQSISSSIAGQSPTTSI